MSMKGSNEMAKIVRREKYICVSFKKNSNKEWTGIIRDDGTYEVVFGRVNGTMQSKTKDLGSVEAADAKMDKDIKSKTRASRGEGKVYTPFQGHDAEGTSDVTANGSSSAKKLTGKKLETVAIDQISHSDPMVSDLIRRLASENVHQILDATSLTYDDTTGLFSTAMGIVTATAVEDARALLVELGDKVQDDDYGVAFVNRLESYMRLIPQDVGYKKLDAQAILSDLNAVQEQNAILDALLASIDSVESGAQDKVEDEVEEEAAQVFDVTLELVEDGKAIDGFRKFYRKTRKDQHTCAHLDVKRVFKVEIATMKRAFETKGRPLGNVQRLFHGTRTSNLLSILRGGLVIMPATSPVVCGRMFFSGAYFAPASTKALNYAAGYWHGGRDDNCFMFTADVAMGNPYTPPGPMSSPAPKGYDSVWAKAGKSGVMNDECIVPKVSQCNLTHLLEFSPQGR